MKTSRIVVSGILLAGTLALAFSPRPDFKTSSTTRLIFKGALGTMMKMVGGNKPMTGTQYIQGHKSRQDNIDDEGKITTSSIIDLDREVMITIDHKKKEYTEMTFAELREMFKGLGEKAKTAQDKPKSEADVKVSFDVKVNRTGEKKNIAGYETEKVILTLTAKGEAQDKNSAETGKGGMIVRSTNWVAANVKGYDEVQAFHLAFAEKLGMMSGGGPAQMIESLSKMNPQLAEAMKKLEQESKKLQGVALMTETVFETWAEPSEKPTEAPAAQAGEQQPPKSVGGLLGGFGKKLGQKVAKKDDAASSDGRNVLMESVTEVTFLGSTSVDAGLFAAPAGYKKKESKN
ncbi:MAG: DUF4412 domain-containing protein [candidate division KSB1 bacterium]|nr:DUF4412 domain-containing protein [candidate division KSB1 bacterium]MDZ7364640.1 DUF4412 domain-containing protein [candidate division KSB1 bacterium]MDZ7402612.1 DUF4412 domain-containing protein [candidate division KSB1 bacterium]